MVRLYSVKGLDYAEHVTEYGVHWNFFFTLGLLPPFVEVFDIISRKVFRSYSVLAIILAVAYELVLDNTELLRYILVSQRGPDLLSKNREGVFSLIGYLAIFLSGRGTGMSIMQYNMPTSVKALARDPTDRTWQERRVVLKKLAIQAGMYVVLFTVSTSVYTFNLNVSRRLANLPYVLWIAAFNNAQILLLGLVESQGPRFSYLAEDADKVKNATSRVLGAFNRNGLVIFLVANLLTGLVNLTVNTLDMGNLNAMLTLVVYGGAVTGVALALDFYGVKVKI
jgi:phosphatidylinositol glycan class W